MHSSQGRTREQRLMTSAPLMASWQCSHRLLYPVLPTGLGAAPHPTVLDRQQCTFRIWSKDVQRCPKMSAVQNLCSPCAFHVSPCFQGSRSIKAEMQSHQCSCGMLQGCHMQPPTCMQPTKRYCNQDLNPAKTATNCSNPKIITLHSLHSLHSVGFSAPLYIDFHFAKQRQILFHWKANVRKDPENLQAHDDAATGTSNLILKCSTHF